MSNSRRLHGSRPALPRCGACGGPVRKAMMRETLPDGRIICTRCTERGVLARRLPCGHLGVPGMTVLADSADLSNFRCIRCSPHAAPGILAEGRRLGMHIRMRHYISGGRFDGRVWPDAGIPFEVPDWEGHDLIRGGNAVPGDEAAMARYEQIRAGGHDAWVAAVRGEDTPGRAAEQVVVSGPSATAAGPSATAAEHHQTGAGQAAQATQHAGTAGQEAAAAAEPAGAPAGIQAGGSPGELAGLAAEPLVAAADTPAAAPGPSADTPAAAPGPSAAKQAWIDHAVTEHKADPAEAAAMTKADLMSRYGGRL